MSGTEEGIQWRNLNDDGFEYAIQQGPHGDEFVKLLDGSCLRRTTPSPQGRGPGEHHAFISGQADDVVSRVVEWDDRTSPDDFPEALLITPSELHRELMRFAEDIGALPAPTVPRAEHQPENSICKFCARRVFEPCQSITQAQNACTLARKG